MNYEEEINKIHRRNHKVEANKVWETSNTRKLAVAILTYFVMILRDVCFKNGKSIYQRRYSDIRILALNIKRQFN